MTDLYAPERDLSGRLIAELPTRELERRLAILRRDCDNHFIAVQYKRAYEGALRDREAQRREAERR